MRRPPRSARPPHAFVRFATEPVNASPTCAIANHADSLFDGRNDTLYGDNFMFPLSYVIRLLPGSVCPEGYSEYRESVCLL